MAIVGGPGSRGSAVSDSCGGSLPKASTTSSVTLSSTSMPIATGALYRDVPGRPAAARLAEPGRVQRCRGASCYDDDDQERGTQRERDDSGRETGQPNRIETQPMPAGHGLHCGQRGQQCNRHQFGEPAHQGPGQDPLRDSQADQLEGVTSGGRGQYGDPRCGHWPALPSAGPASAPPNAAVAARMTGTPMGNSRVGASANPAPARATAPSVPPAFTS